MLPGGRVGVDRVQDLPRAVLAASWLLGPAASRVIRSAGHGRRGHDAQRSWARQASRLLRLRVGPSGLGHVDGGQPYVVAPLHEGFADVVALLGLPLDMRFVARSELESWHRLGRCLRATGQILVEPEKPTSAMRTILHEARRTFENNQSLVLFPQGTILGVETAFNPSAFGIAARFGVPLLPVVLTGSHRVWEHPFSPRLRFGVCIRMEVMAPLDPGDAVAGMKELEREMKRRALAADPSPRRFDPAADGWWDEYVYEIDPTFAELAAAVAEHRSLVGAGDR